MSVNIFLKRRLVLDTFQLFDDTNGIYTVFIPPMSTVWTNALFKVRRSSDNATAYLFADGLELSFDNSSFISTTSNTTPSATTLGTWYGSNDLYIEEQYCITPDNTIDTNKTLTQTVISRQPKLATAGGIALKNGKPTIDFTGVRYFNTPVANSILDSGNTFSIFTVSSNESTSTGVILTTNITGGADSTRVLIFNERSASKRIGLLATSTSNYSVLTAAQENTNNQKILGIIVDSSNIHGYHNGNLTDSNTWTGTYLNEKLQIGIQFSSLTALTGSIQLLVFYDSDKTANAADIQDYINNYFSIY